MRISIVTACVISLIAAAVPAAAQEEVLLRFDMPGDRVLEYKGSESTEMNFSGMDITLINGYEIEMSLEERLEGGKAMIALEYVKASSKMMRSGAFQEWDNPVKPEGRTVKVVVDSIGTVVEAHGFIMGLKEGRQIEQFVDSWFFELPADPVGEGSKWSKDIDEKGNGEEEYSVTGKAGFELKKFEEKKGIRVAVIQGKGKLNIRSVTGQGVFEGESEIEMKFAVAVEGGFVVEGERSVETRGAMISENAYTGEKTENDVARYESSKVELKD